MIPYLIEAAILNALLLMVYFLFLRNETDFRIRRVILLSSIAMAIFVPFITLEIPDNFFNEKQEVYTTYLNPAVVGSASNDIARSIFSNPTLSSQFDIIRLLYVLVSGTIFLFLIIGFRKVNQLRQKSTLRYIDRVYIYQNPELDHSFSFLNWIFIKENDPKPIIEHEIAHVKLLHSMDVLFAQLFKVFFWWTPTSWIIFNELRLIHEYQADAYALKNGKISEYKELLVANTLETSGLKIVSSFHHGELLKRLNIMSGTYQKINQWKLRIVSFLLMITAVGFTCTDQFDAEINKVTSWSNQITYKELPAELQSQVEDNPMFRYVVFDAIELRNNSLGIKVNRFDPEIIYKMLLVKGEKDENDDKIYMVLSRNKQGLENPIELEEVDPNNTFTIVEKQPEYPGGMNAFYKEIGQKIIYPKDALSDSIEGRVFVQFTVGEDGRLSNIQAVKGIHPALDQEAVRALSNLKKFIPGSHNGKNVPVRMVLPVIFKLNNNPTIILKMSNSTETK